jgi:hypothetical protein
VEGSADRKTKLAALRERIVHVAKSDDLLAVARELEAIGQELASDEGSERPTRPETTERPQRSTSVTWPRDMNESPEKTSPGWGHDPAEDVRG